MGTNCGPAVAIRTLDVLIARHLAGCRAAHLELLFRGGVCPSVIRAHCGCGQHRADDGDLIRYALDPALEPWLRSHVPVSWQLVDEGERWVLDNGGPEAYLDWPKEPSPQVALAAAVLVVTMADRIGARLVPGPVWSVCRPVTWEVPFGAERPCAVWAQWNVGGWQWLESVMADGRLEPVRNGLPLPPALRQDPGT